MKKLLLLVCILPFIAVAQNIDSAWFANNYTKKEIMIPMRDGIKLFTAVYIPNSNSEKHPFLMTRTPYTSAPYGEKNYRAFYTNHYKEYLKEGYIMVVQDVRGRWMSEGEFVDVAGVSKGKGFAGTVKRHNFRTQDATHGNSRSHRVPGSTGQNQTPGRVFKGKKMAGHLGNKRCSVIKLEIVRVDTERNLLLIKGGIPGAPGVRVEVRPSTRKKVRGE